MSEPSQSTFGLEFQTQQIDADVLKQCVFLAGPTASGKTDIAVELARLIPIEVVSLDSMCVYRDMDIGTAKPSAAVRDTIPHHLIDVVDPHEEFSVAEYLIAARQACEGILSRGACPVFVGGTGLYLRSILRGVFEGPPANNELRERLQKQSEDAAKNGDHFWLMRQLEKVDADSGQRLHPNDHRRLIRALEVFELTGQPLSKQQNQPALPADARPQRVFWLEPPREWLHDRINRRVEAMFQQGLEAEVRMLLSRQPPIGSTASQGLGYKEIIDALERNPETRLNSEQRTATIELIQTRTRQFAKRQHTWFRNMEECHPVELAGTETPAEIARRLALYRPL